MFRKYSIEPELAPNLESWLKSPGDLDDFLFYPEKDGYTESQK